MSRAARNRSVVGSIVAVVVLGGVLGVVDPSRADTGVVRVRIAGALTAAIGTTADGQITLRIAASRPVSLVSGGAVVPGTIGTATYAQWTDTLPSTGFAPSSTLIVFRLGGGVMLVAGGIATPGGFLTTFSATPPYQTLSGTWTMASGAGVSGADAGDAIVTLTYDTNPSITISGSADFVAGGAVAALVDKIIPGVASVQVLRNIPAFEVVAHAKGAQVGILAGHAAFAVVGDPSEFVELRAIAFSSGVFLIYACAFPGPASGIECLIGATGSVSHLSGHLSQLAGMFSSIAGVTPSDLVLNLTGRLP